MTFCSYFVPESSSRALTTEGAIEERPRLSANRAAPTGTILSTFIHDLLAGPTLTRQPQPHRSTTAQSRLKFPSGAAAPLPGIPLRRRDPATGVAPRGPFQSRGRRRRP